MFTLRAFLVFLAAVSMAASACSGSNRTAEQAGTAGAIGAEGIIAFVDEDGCIARVDARTGAPAADPFCTASRAGVTAVTWIDGDRLAFVTAEGRALGWQLVDFKTGRVTVMDMQEAPRVFLIPPQYWSPRGEQVEVDRAGIATVSTSEGPLAVFPPRGEEADPTTRLVAWSPDANSLLLSVTTGKGLWVVGRDGSNPRQIATASRGAATWWMPHVGVTPHADLTCSVIVEGSYTCVPGVRGPNEGGATFDFAWSPCPGATGYEVQVLDSSGKVVFEVLTAGNFAHVPKARIPAGEHSWRIRSLIGPIPAPWSEPASFAPSPA